MASMAQLSSDNPKLPDIDSNSSALDGSEEAPVYSLLNENQLPIDSEKNEIPNYAVVDKSNKPPPLPKPWSADVPDSLQRPDIEKSTKPSSLPLSVKPYIEEQRKQRKTEELMEPGCRNTYMNVTSSSGTEHQDVMKSSFGGKTRRFSGILQRREFNFSDGSRSSSDAKKAGQIRKVVSLVQKNWTIILMAFVIAIFSICIVAAFIEISRVNRVQQPMGLNITDVEGAIEKYMDIYSNRSCTSALDGVQCQDRVSFNNSYIMALEELLDKYNDRLNSSNTCSINDASAGVMDFPVCNFCQSEMNSTWIRVTELNMSDPSSQCPPNFTLNSNNGVRTCMAMMPSASCTSVFFSMHNVTYSKVFGKIRAYQYGVTNSFKPFNRGNGTIDEPYVDGVSVTYGQPRQHIWTFAADLRKNDSFCPCSSRQDTSVVPEYVGEDYFCDTGEARKDTLAADSPLWDGTGCGLDYSCCSYNNPPWFYKQLPAPTSEPIELRVCLDQSTSNENIALEAINIYVCNY